MKSAQELEGDELLDALGVEVEEAETGGYTPKQERILAGFEDVVRFRETHGRAPQHGPTLDIFERLYAVRLDQLRKLPEDNLALLRPLDRFGLLKPPADSGEQADALRLNEQREKIIAALGSDLKFDEMPGKKSCAIYESKPWDISHRDEWQSLYVWLKERGEAYATLFKPLVAQLKLG